MEYKGCFYLLRKIIFSAYAVKLAYGLFFSFWNEYDESGSSGEQISFQQ